MRRIHLALTLTLLSLAALACSKDQAKATSDLAPIRSPQSQDGRGLIQTEHADLYLPLDETISDHVYDLTELLGLAEESRGVAYFVVNAQGSQEIISTASLLADDKEAARPEAISSDEARELVLQPTVLEPGIEANAAHWSLQIQGEAHISGIGVKFVDASEPPANGGGQGGGQGGNDRGGNDGRDRDENSHVAFVRSGFHGISQLELVRYVKQQVVRGRTIKRILVKGNADPDSNAQISFCRSAENCGRAQELSSELGTIAFNFGNGLNTRDFRNYAFDIRGDAYVEMITLEFSSR